MFEKKFILNAINRSAETAVDRRKLLAMTGIAGAGIATAMVAGGAEAANADPTSDATDAAVLNFALNLEYLEAEFYLRAVNGHGLPTQTSLPGVGTFGHASGGHKVDFKTPAIHKYAQEIAHDERTHVEFLKQALGSAAVCRPTIDLKASFTAAALAAGVIKKGQSFDPFANEVNFLLGAFIFEDVGVTAYKGAAGFITNKTYLDAAAGILAVEAYHAGIIRNTLYAIGVETPSIYGTVQKISDARDSLDGKADMDQGIKHGSSANLVPTDHNGIAYSRTTGQVLNIAFLNPNAVTSGGFYPDGVNGSINTSAQSV